MGFPLSSLVHLAPSELQEQGGNALSLSHTRSPAVCHHNHSHHWLQWVLSPWVSHGAGRGTGVETGLCQPDGGVQSMQCPLPVMLRALQRQGSCLWLMATTGTQDHCSTAPG